MKVSILVPTYNSERHLAECLDSVLAQDYAGLEILVADDNSTDGTVPIIKEYATRDARLRWWQNPRTLGLVGNHNACLREARGEFIKFVHADDKFLVPSAVRKMAAALEANPSAVLVGCRQHLTGAKSSPTIFAKVSGLFNGRQTIVASLEQNTNLIGQPTLAMFRQSAAARGFDVRFTGHLDFEMWFHLLERGDFYYLAEDLATWRVHSGQQTARRANNGAVEDEQLMFMECYCAKPWLKLAATDRMWFSQIYYLRKKYGRRAGPVTSVMMAQIRSPAFAWQWVRHKLTRPVQNFARHLRLRSGFSPVATQVLPG